MSTVRKRRYNTEAFLTTSVHDSKKFIARGLNMQKWILEMVFFNDEHVLVPFFDLKSEADEYYQQFKDDARITEPRPENYENYDEFVNWTEARKKEIESTLGKYTT